MKGTEAIESINADSIGIFWRLHCVAGRVTHPGGRYSTQDTRSKRETTYCPFLGSTEPPIVNDFG